MKIGVLTYHRAENYGAFLQAYGLCSRLNEENDIEAEIIDFHMDKEIEQYSLKKRVSFRIFNLHKYSFLLQLHKTFQESVNILPKSNEYLHSDNIEKFKEFVSGRYDIIIAGSDEIWKIDGFRGFPTPYWLPKKLKCKKMSYAASSRTDIGSISEEKKNEVASLLNDFSFISVRDKITYNQILNNINTSCKMILSPDPSLIYNYSVDVENGKKIIKEKAKYDLNKKVAIVMTGDSKVAQLIRKRYAEEYQLISVFNYHKGYINIANLNPFEWINLIAASDFVFTSYFHAVCFSIINNISFLAIGTKSKSEKVMDVLNACNNNYRFVETNRLYEKDCLEEMVSKCKKLPDCQIYLQNCKESFNEYLKEVRKIYTEDKK